MRVFLELSSEFYLTAKQIAIPARHSKSHWGDSGLSLELKIRTVLENLDPAKRDHELLSARQGISSSEHGHSVSNLHGYIHNRNADAEGREVKRVWERWQPYFQRLFDSLRTP
jgi:ppGpp synthetase/RelA/SpoT-type nucleotidyltranferase